ncbi:MAG: helix-turn-helix transcriptional regulator [Cytophagaceae bacterium]|nr:helix-turn-helix transcriptional regulator [Cytophagaceae bacterium]MBK9509596.1 helix-turn-helix transcriptional regulator [Cytophagaceae bacterium]MBK9936176.1 helix-turn-helix transcriptional regulator [Cytophagaceae bacterium]MBL0303936.1 helix-turn-helix transcriptional regulator [Cytophagaceae bacterium]MBL0326749.1 helix-turn-helix transcriptional regulator [Cytophagaceae bacterium]
MELRDKIEKLIIGLGLSAARFADYINVSRPIISHILSNRNKPSLEIIQKIISKFPELGYEWISDEKDIDKTIIQKLAKDLNFQFRSDDFYDERELNIPIQYKGEEKIFNSQALPNQERKEVKVMIFYSDGTVESFIPK